MISHASARPRRASLLILIAALLLAAGLTGSAPASAAPGVTALVVVRNESNAPLSGAQVWRDGVLVGSTNGSGQINVPNALAGQKLTARQLVFTGNAPKGEHDGWSYHVWLTNIDQNNDGTQTEFTIANPAITQNLVVKRTDAEIGFNILVSYEYNATPDAMNDLSAGLVDASQYLFDVTDGQMYFEKVTIREDGSGFSNADFQMFANVWPNADVLGMKSGTGHVHFPGPGFNGSTYTGSFTNSDAFRTMIHEFGHYTFGAYDEYIKSDNGKTVGSLCTLDRDTTAENDRASIMDYQYNSTELCADGNHNSDTNQGQINGESVWQTVVDNWDGAQWDLRTPMSRGSDDPGPFSLPAFAQVTPTIVAAPGVACPGIPVTVTAITGHPAGIPGTLEHNGNYIAEGATDENGQMTIYGAVPGDTLSFFLATRGSGSQRTWYSGGATITNCDPLTIQLHVFIQLNYMPRWHIDWHINELEILIDPFERDDLALNVLVNQDRLRQSFVKLGYNSDSHLYEGAYSFDVHRAADFNIAISLYNQAQEQTTANFQLEGARFQAAGPAAQELQGKVNGPTAQSWQLFQADNRVNLTVSSTSLPDGAGVVIGDTALPKPAPGAKFLVAGPFSVDSSDPLNAPVGLNLRYDPIHTGPLNRNSIVIYYYNPGTDAWEPLPTTLIDPENQASTKISQFGIYAIFASEGPEPTPTQTRVPSVTPTPTQVACDFNFSDVHAADFFYTPVRYLYCNGVISGYADHTFRPGANATRGQISKIVVLAEGFTLAHPANPTFSDVPTTDPFYAYVETASARALVSGYADGTFKPQNNVTRGQLSKIVVKAEGWTLVNPANPTFNDVATTNPFYKEIETAFQHNIISGYADHTFRWGNNATRGQISKIVYSAVTGP